MKYTAHILSHTHWDREWYLNSPYTNEWLIPFFDGLFSMLKKEPDYKFVLDGQLSMVEDYFEELSKNGMSVSNAKRTIRTHVERKALFIGPYYLQPDWQLLSEESLVRNLLIGGRLADSLGGGMKSGWLLDNFGQISQTAQIHKLAGLEGLFVWRGVAMDPQRVTSEFVWESPDGTRILAIYLLNSYRNVMRLAEYGDIMQKRMEMEVKKLQPFATTSNLLMMNGYDQEMIPDDIQPYIRTGKLNGENYETIQNDPDSYIRAVDAEKPDLPVLTGALYDGRFISVFPGVMSSRMYLKIQNDQMQKLLEQRVEPMALLASQLGDDYGKNQIDQAWKLLLKNHPHDSICGVSIDDVHLDMEQRSRQVHQLAQSLLEDKLSTIAALADTSSAPGHEAMIVFNTMLRQRSTVVQWKGESRFVRNIPAMGFKVVTEQDSVNEPLKTGARYSENNRICFDLNDNGSFNIYFKETHRNYLNLGILEDMGDSGDEYNYSYPDKDQVITTEGIKAQISLIRDTPWEACFRVSYQMDLPVSDINSHTERSRETAAMPVVSYYTVEANSPVVKCRTCLKNTVKDHRVRTLFPTGFKAETAFAASPFDITERPIHRNRYSEEVPEHVARVIVGARESEPSTYFHTREFLDLNDGREGMAVFSKGLPEYQIVDGGTVALTLFRSVGWIAKEINTRIGDAGPEIYTPDAQCLREMTFEYAVCPHTGDAYSGVTAQADEFNNDVIVISSSAHDGPLGSDQSWFNMEDSTGCVKVTGIKRSEDGSGLIVRGVNLSDKATKVEFHTSYTAEKASLTDFMEKDLVALPINNGFVGFQVKSKEIFTLKLQVAKNSKAVIPKIDVVLETVHYRENFSAYPYTDYVTVEDIENEKNRAVELEARMDDPMWRRTALEAQLSVILARHRKDDQEIRSLGYQLNEARVHRRIHDYLTANIPLSKQD